MNYTNESRFNTSYQKTSSNANYSKSYTRDRKQPAIGEDELERQYQALAGIDYEFYVDYANPVYKHGPHTRLISKKLMEIEAKQARGEATRTIIQLPPRHSKSYTITETFPSWFIGRDPNRKVIQVSYGAALARDFGLSNRRKVEQIGPAVFDISVDSAKAQATDWQIEGYRGGMIAAGIGGSITGKGADLLVIDDPIKSHKEANSLTYRNMVWNEWRNTLRTRLSPGAAVILILTRWHEDDIAGRLINEEAGRWDVLRLPAIAEDQDDPLGREIGEPLWPEGGFNAEWAQQTEKEVGAQTWAALYQQRPSPPDGQTFKRKYWKYYNVAPTEFDELIQSWDLAFKDSDGSDYVAGQVWGRIGADCYLLDQVHEKLSFSGTIQAIENLSAKWKDTSAKYVEDKANGPAVINMLGRRIMGLIPVNPEGGKQARANAISPLLEAGNVWLPDRSIAPWIDGFIEEAAAFPNGRYDDRIDSMTQALIKLMEPSGPLIGRG